MLGNAEKGKAIRGGVSVTKARPGLASVQTREAATGGTIIDDLRYALKIGTLTSCTTIDT